MLEVEGVGAEQGAGFLVFFVWVVGGGFGGLVVGEGFSGRAVVALAGAVGVAGAVVAGCCGGCSSVGGGVC